jgi:hypothetical protein
MINTLADLKTLFELCRSHEVAEINAFGVRAKFSYIPTAAPDVPIIGDADSDMPQELTGDDLIFYSSERPAEMEG